MPKGLNQALRLRRQTLLHRGDVRQFHTLIHAVGDDRSSRPIRAATSRVSSSDQPTGRSVSDTVRRESLWPILSLAFVARGVSTLLQITQKPCETMV